METITHHKITRQDFLYIHSVTVKVRKINHSGGDLVSISWVQKGEPFNLVYTFTGYRVSQELVKGQLHLTDLSEALNKPQSELKPKYLGTAEMCYDDVFNAINHFNLHTQKCSNYAITNKEFYL